MNEKLKFNEKKIKYVEKDKKVKVWMTEWKNE